MKYIPDQGDIVYFSFDPSSGKEIMKRRPAFVLSKRIFNDHTGFAVVAPITSTIRNIQLEVVLPDDMTTSGSVMVHQLKSLDFEDRKAKLIEATPLAITQKVLGIARAIIA
ncbi:MAG: mRNA-degrading endonuclease toxin of MazEF toxin-antitoxin module [Parasphingorhabdus sp.]